MRNYFTFSHMAAGFISVMVGFTSSAVLVFQAATEAGATPTEVSSWLFALGMSIAMSCIGLSLPKSSATRSAIVCLAPSAAMMFRQ
jgi:benzoate membrane transport protein